MEHTFTHPVTHQIVPVRILLEGDIIQPGDFYRCSDGHWRPGDVLAGLTLQAGFTVLWVRPENPGVVDYLAGERSRVDPTEYEG